MQRQTSGTPTWAKVVIGLAVTIVLLFILAGVAGVFFASRMVKVVSDQISGAGNWSASTYWQRGTLMADITFSPGSQTANKQFKLSKVTLDGTPCQEPLPAFPKNGKSITIPFNHSFKAKSGTLSISYDDGHEQWTQSFPVDIPPKPSSLISAKPSK